MIESIRLIFLVPAIAVFIAALSTLLERWFRNEPKLGLKEMVLCASPSLLLLGLFYSLALHMYRRLGAWPQSIGEQGFPPGLLMHVNVAINYFCALLLATLFVWPVSFFLCWIIRPWRRWTTYLRLHVLSFSICVGLMLLAPSHHLYWWRD